MKTVDYNFEAVNSELDSLHWIGKNELEGEVEEGRNVRINMAAAVEQQRFNQFAGADSVALAQTIAVHYLLEMYG